MPYLSTLTERPGPGGATARAARARLLAGLRGVLLAGLAVLGLGAVGGALAQPEQNVKAAFVFNFVRFTEWPAARFATRDAPQSLCLLSSDTRLSESMKGLAGRTVDERTVRVSDVERPEDLARCHALFIADTTPRGSMGVWLRKAESLDVLTMGDSDGFAAGGGMIGLVSDGLKVRFEINDKAVKRSGLKLGSQLYQLGRGVSEAIPR